MSGLLMLVFELMLPALVWLDAAFTSVLAMSGCACIVALIIIAFRFILRKKLPAWFSYALWLVLLLRLIIPVGLLTSPVSLFNLEKTVSDAATRIAGNAGTHVAVAPSEAPVPSALVPAYDPGTAAPTPPESMVNQTAPNVGVTVRITPYLSVIAAIVWIVGAAAFLIYAVVAHIATLRRLRFAVSFDGGGLLDDCAKRIGLRRRVKLVTSDVYGSPVVYGLIKPRVVLPLSMADTEPEVLRAVITHELYHIKRLDLLWNLVAVLALAVHWFNPVVWLAHILSRRDRERSCDELTLTAIGDNRRYAEALYTVSELRSGAGVGMLAFGEEGVKARIKAALDFRKKSRWLIAASVLLIIAACATLAVGAMPPKPLSISDAAPLVLRELESLYPEGFDETGIIVEEYAARRLFEETGMQIFHITSGFRQHDAFVIRDGRVVCNIPGYGGYGVTDVALSDFNADGKFELLYMSSNASGDDGMLRNTVGIYDPRSRSARSAGGPRVYGTISIRRVTDREFNLVGVAGEVYGTVKGTPGSDPILAVIDLTDTGGMLSISAYPSPYSLAMSSSPGIRIDVAYGGLYSGVRYQASGGAFLTWEDGQIEHVGTDVTRLGDKPVYWFPDSDDLKRAEITVTVLYDIRLDNPYAPDNVLTEDVLPVTKYGELLWYVGEGMPPIKTPAESPQYTDQDIADARAVVEALFAARNARDDEAFGALWIPAPEMRTANEFGTKFEDIEIRLETGGGMRDSYLSYGRGRDNGTLPGNCIVFVCEFTVSGEHLAAWGGAGRIGGWNVILIREDASSPWLIDGEGY